ncbi:MAG: flagellar hook-basal body complex protein [Sulfobacillus sp.]|nr:flagellar hook-basal body complex protein [Sulfobacillus sp.]
MFNVLGISTTGLTTESQVLGAVAANIANADTPGYASRVTTLADTGAVTERPPGVSLANQVLAAPLSLNEGALLASDTPSFGQGVQPTQIASNVAVQGAGFFMVSTPSGIAYTRAGNFTLDAGGELVLPSGAKLYPPVVIPQGEPFNISADGVVTVGGAQGPQVVGRIQLADIPNPSGLVALGNNLYGLSVNSGTPVVGAPGQNGLGTLVPSAVNQSGTDLAQNLVNLVQAETVYAMNAKVITVDQTVNQATTNLQV